MTTAASIRSREPSRSIARNCLRVSAACVSSSNAATKTWTLVPAMSASLAVDGRRGCLLLRPPRRVRSVPGGRASPPGSPGAAPTATSVTASTSAQRPRHDRNAPCRRLEPPQWARSPSLPPSRGRRTDCATPSVRGQRAVLSVRQTPTLRRNRGHSDSLEVPRRFRRRACRGDTGTLAEGSPDHDPRRRHGRRDRPARRSRRPASSNSLTGVGALDGSFWGLLFGILFFVPILGLADGRRRPASAGRLDESTSGSTTTSSTVVTAR